MDPVPNLKELLASFWKASPFQQQLASARLRSAWQRAMPKAVCDRTERIYLHKGKIVLKINSAPLRQELHSNRDKLLALFQEALPQSALQEVLVL